jgi:hypothetical protein
MWSLMFFNVFCDDVSQGFSFIHDCCIIGLVQQCTKFSEYWPKMLSKSRKGKMGVTEKDSEFALEHLTDILESECTQRLLYAACVVQAPVSGDDWRRHVRGTVWWRNGQLSLAQLCADLHPSVRCIDGEELIRMWKQRLHDVDTPPHDPQHRVRAQSVTCDDDENAPAVIRCIFRTLDTLDCSQLPATVEARCLLENIGNAL